MPLTAVHLHPQHGHTQACPRQMHCVARENSVWLATLRESSVYREPISAQQQIRPVTLRFL
jgi:hypothetical protein